MSTSLYLYCKETGEAVPTIRLGGGIVTPEGQYSNKAQFFFMAYHQRLQLKHLKYEMSELEGREFDDLHFVGSLAEMKEEKEMLVGLEHNPKFLLRWDDKNCEELLNRDSKQFEALKDFDFGVHSLRKTLE